MKKINGWEDIKPADDYSSIPAGGYVVKITEVTDKADKEYLDIVFDIAEGPEKGRYSDEWSKEHPYAHHVIKSYKEDPKIGALFKAFTNAVEESNSGYNWTFEEQTLVGKLIGVVIGYEEYETNHGEIRQRTYVKTVKTVQAIREKNYTVPDLKKLARQEDDPRADFTPLNDDCPF